MNQREQQRLATRNLIYKCAIDLFMARPYDLVKVTDIVSAAGVSVGAFYYHFASKENIIAEGYRLFDDDLRQMWENADIKPGIDGIEFLIRCQLEDCCRKGVELTTVYFKNQLSTTNAYLFDKNRYFYQALLKNVAAVNRTDTPSTNIVDAILRSSRGTIYDWCLRKGAYDLVDTGLKEVRIQLKHYKLIQQ
ncbi:MAG TPA: TetR/AcrR family transcriptional regulator [Firmicutes bacterium]|nr:TetR/AcrR family transcriptional regulator [Bacillota bacterium]